MSLSLATRRECALGMARWSARRMAISEVHYFHAAVNHARAGHERARMLRERWRRLAIEFGEFLDDAAHELAEAGMAAEAYAIVEAARVRIATARAAHLDALGLGGRLGEQTPLAVESGRMPAVALN